MFRRYLHAWQEVIECSEELHQVLISDEMKKAIRLAVESTKESQRRIINYLRLTEEVLTKMDEAIGEFPEAK